MNKRTIVICPQCFQSTHELTEEYDKDKPINGTMVRMSEPYRSWGWEGHAEDDIGTGEGDIQCGHCGEQLIKDGVIITEEVYDVPETVVKKKRRRKKR